MSVKTTENLDYKDLDSKGLTRVAFALQVHYVGPEISQKHKYNCMWNQLFRHTYFEPVNSFRICQNELNSCNKVCSDQTLNARWSVFFNNLQPVYIHP